MADGEITLSVEAAIATLTIDNVDRMNAVSLHMWRQLNDALGSLEPATRCVVLRGAGGKAFASGADISEFKGLRREPVARAAYDEAAYNAMNRLFELAQPTVAVISGYCIGAGMALALSCDVRLASDASKFGIPAARLGLGYGHGEMKRLVDAVGVAPATDMLISARRFSAQEACSMGLVTRIYPATDLDSEAAAYTEAVTKNAPLTVQASKRIIKELAASSPNSDLVLCQRLTNDCFSSDDYLEGIEAFLEKRQPAFKGE